MDLSLLIAFSLTFPPALDLAKRGMTGPPNPRTARLELTNLPPSKLTPNLCVLKYRVTTSSPECQAFFDEGLGYFYSYVWMEAARSFETAARYDPDCAMAWWGLSRALESYRRGD